MAELLNMSMLFLCSVHSTLSMKYVTLLGGDIGGLDSVMEKMAFWLLLRVGLSSILATVDL